MVTRSMRTGDLLATLCGVLSLVGFASAVKANAQDGPAQRLVEVEPGFEVPAGIGIYQVTSRDGRIVAFVPFRGVRFIGFPQQLPNDGNAQVLIVDRSTGAIELASRTPAGGFQINGNPSTESLSISDAGDRLVFSSAARNMDPAVTLSLLTTFLYDRATQTVRAIDIDPGRGAGFGGGVIDGAGQTALILCRGRVGMPDSEIGLCQLRIDTGSVRLIRRFPVNDTLLFQLSRDGRSVALAYNGPILTSGAPNPGRIMQIYVMSVETGEVELISAAPDGRPGDFGSGGSVAISDDGEFVAYFTFATNILPGGGPFGAIVMKQQSTGVTRQVSTATAFRSGTPVLSGDGRRLLYMDFGVTGDKVRIYDWQTNTSRPAVGAPGGVPNGPICEGSQPRSDLQQRVAISGDGRTIVFPSLASNLVPGDVPNTCDLFVRQLGPVPQPATPVHGPNRVWLAVLVLLLALAAVAAVRRAP